VFERSREYLTPQYQLLLRAASVQGVAGFAATLAVDPSRTPLTLCATQVDACSGDVRLYRWGNDPREHVRAVRFTARSGALLSGHVWAYGDRARRRPGVVITPGSLGVDEEMYWWAAQTLARHGYAVLSYDLQSQGRSDVLGVGADLFRNAAPQSMPSFVENTEDALRFLRSTPADRYAPVTAATGCDTRPGARAAAARQEERAGFGRADGYNPFHALLQRDRIALAAHSYGTLGPAVIGQCVPAVRATVAWDNLRAGPGSDQGIRLPAPRVPALGISQDYGFPALPHNADPDPEAKNAGFTRYVKAGVDVLQINVRGATHTDWSYLPNPLFAASLRGLDLATWYTLAWLDRYVRHDKRALSRVLTNRWREPESFLSFYYRSRLAVTVRTRRGKKLRARAVRCDDLRAGCAALGGDDHPGEWSYLRFLRVAP
ncbi:MAG TPA: hypothetical protein VFZ89_07100, partial [Solirubrobacteraceae bacterium]